MSESPNLTEMINEKMQSEGWNVADLHRKVCEAGATVTSEGVRQWVRGGGVSSRHLGALAVVLEVSVGDVVAAAGRA